MSNDESIWIMDHQIFYRSNVYISRLPERCGWYRRTKYPGYRCDICDCVGGDRDGGNL